MKKLFTFAAALLASLMMSAQTITLSEVTPESNWYGVEGLGRVANKSGSAFSDGEMSCEGITGFKTGSSYFTIQTYSEISTLIVGAQSGSNRSIKAITVSEDLQSAAQSASNVEFELIGGNEDYAIVSKACGNEFTLNFTNAVPANSYIQIVFSGNAEIFAVSFGSATPSTDPVTAAEISGDEACMVGNSITLTCTAAKATSYQWYLDGIMIDDANAKTYTFTPTAAGEYTFTCAATNDYTDTPVLSDEHVITVVDPDNVCGELIKATTNKEVSGVIGGSVDTNLSSGTSQKLNKKKYFGITLANGTFQAGDIFAINITAGADLGNFMLYADKEGNELIFDEGLTYTKDTVENPVICETGLKEIVLPAAVADKSSLYLYRENGNTQWNVTFDYISVSRECGASSNAEMGKVWVLVGEEAREYAAAEDGNYYLVVPASVELAEVKVYFSLAHPRATANVSSPVTIAVPAAGAEANSQVITVTAEDGEHQKSYTIFVSKSDQMSTDASLKSLAVTGFTLDPTFAADVFSYTITKPYGAENPGTDAVVYELNDPTAHDKIQAQENTLIITVTAEDGQTQLVYTITIVESAANKALLRATFSNGVHGFIAGNEINVPYLASEVEPTFVSATFWNADGEPTAEIVEGNLVVTGIDSQSDTYTINYVALTPMTYSDEEVTFTEVPSYIYSVYGWDVEKGVKFAKDAEEATNHRISEGKDRIYIALPAGKEVLLTSGSAASRPVTITINGEVSNVTNTAKSNEAITLPLSAEHANFIGIESNGSSGDAGFISLKMNSQSEAIDNTNAEFKAVKVIRNGQLLIIKNGVLYNAQGIVAE